MGLPGQNQGDGRLSSFWRLQGRVRPLVFSSLPRLFTFLGSWPLPSFLLQAGSIGPRRSPAISLVFSSARFPC